MRKLKLYIITILASVFCLHACTEDEETNLEPVPADLTFEAAESIGDGDIIGTVTTSDDNEALVYSIFSNDNDLFEVTEAGEISLASGKALDYETATSHDIVVSASDGEYSSSIVVQIAVIDDLSDNSTASYNVENASITVDEYSDDIITIAVQFDQPLVINAKLGITLGGTATYGEDYKIDFRGYDAELGLFAGQDSTAIVLSVLDDYAIEDDETITVTLTQASDVLMVDESSSTFSITINSHDTDEAYLLLDGEDMYTYNLDANVTKYLNNITLEDGTPKDDFDNIDFDDGKLYAVESNYIYTIDLGTGVATEFTNILKDSLLYEENDTLTSMAMYGTEIIGDEIYTVVKGTAKTAGTNYYITKYDKNTGALIETNKSEDIFNGYGLGTIDGELYYTVYYYPYIADVLGRDGYYSDRILMGIGASDLSVNGANLLLNMSQEDMDTIGLDYSDQYSTVRLLGLDNGYSLMSGNGMYHLISITDHTGTAEVAASLEGSYSNGCFIPTDAID